MDDFPDVQIKVTIGSKTLEINTPQDSDVDDYRYIFKTIMMFATFGADQIDEVFNEEEIFD